MIWISVPFSSRWVAKLWRSVWTLTRLVRPAAFVAERDAHRAARQGGPEVLGYYHSHPTDQAEPSATDRAMASGDGRVWAVVAAGDVTFWRDDEDGFVKLSSIVTGR